MSSGAARRRDPAQCAGGHSQAQGSTTLAALAARSAPAVPATARLLEVPRALATILPEGGLRRGSTVAVGAGAAPGSVSLTLSLLGPASMAGAWCAAVALPDLGLVAAAELGVAVERLALVPHPGDQWTVVVAALLESVDIVVARPLVPVRPGDARRLIARARERGSVLVVVDTTGAAVGRWPEGADVRLEVTGSVWSGLGRGHGHLQGREVEVTVTGRRGATRARSARVQLPAGTAAAFSHPSGAPVAQVG